MAIGRPFNKQAAARQPEVEKKTKKVRENAQRSSDASIMPVTISSDRLHSRRTDTGVYKSVLSEVTQLKQAILKTHPKKTYRFSFSTMKRVVLPPVDIPDELAHWTVTDTRVAGRTIPMTRTMYNLKKFHMKKHLPASIVE